jgi:UDP-3-O-[3-hydroxymyristoyl] glucosamine N-acyltransferase
MVSLQDIQKFLGAEVVGTADSRSVLRPASIIDSDERSIVWLKRGVMNFRDLIHNTRALAIILPDEIEIDEVVGKVLFKVENPRLAFIRVIHEFFSITVDPGIHPTAFVHKDAHIGPDAYIGPFSYVGKSVVGKGSVIHGNVHIYDNVTIGGNVLIHSGTVIGADGFGYEKDENGEIYKFPHIGGVLIEDNVEIGANTCIDKGSLGNTILKRGAKIDNLVHIAHNVVVGENAFVIANAMVGGSTVIGDNTWIAPSVSLMNGIIVGRDVTVGMSSLVTKNLPDAQTYAGVPARPINEFLALQRKLKDL